jgi:hypothetical protein
MKFADTDFEQYILPIIPAGAKLTLNSTLNEEQLGKIPGEWVSDVGAWRGLANWQDRWVWRSKTALERWQGWQTEYAQAIGATCPIAIAVGMNTRDFNCFDIDSDDPAIADQTETIIMQHIGRTPIVRLRHGSPRRVLFYERDQHTAPISKHRLAFSDGQGNKHIVEYLARGQQVVIEGPHAKGAMHYWRDGGLIEHRAWLAENLVNGDQVNGCMRALGEWVDSTEGFERIKLTLPTGGNRVAAIKIADPSSPHLASDMDLLARAVRAIDLNDPRLDDYLTWIALLIAIKAASGGSRQFYDEVVWPWLQTNPINVLPDRSGVDGEIRMLDKWDSIRDAQNGAAFVYQWAALFGFMDGVHARAQELFKDFPGPAPAIVAEADLLAPEANTSENDGRDENHSTALERPRQKSPRAAPVPKLMPPDFDPGKLPRRPFVLGYRFMAGAVTLGVAPPGTGKSNFSILTALSIATGRPFTDEPVRRPGKIWIHNNEDSLDELYRRIGGVLKFHQIGFDTVRENIFVTSGLDERLVVALKDQDVVKRTMAVTEVIGAIKENRIVHLVIDPLVSTHRGVSENSNEEIEQVAEAIAYIAHETGCSIDLVHHSVKSLAGNPESHAGDMNAARGASALIGAVRIIYTLSQMSTKTGTTLNIPPQLSARLVRLDHGKGNYTARDTSVRWFELATVQVGNGAGPDDGFMVDGDTVAVPVRWQATAVAGDTSKDNPKEADPKEAKRQHLRDFLSNIMETDRAELSSLIAQVQREFGIARTTARDRVMKAIPEDCGGLAQANGISYRLTIERREPSPPNPVFVIRAVIGGGDEDGTGGGVSSMTSDAGADDDIHDEAA